MYYIVFDVDRTLINGTSWVYACTKPGMLMNEEAVVEFTRINEELYNTGKDRNAFRHATLELILKSYKEEQNRNLAVNDSKKSFWKNKLEMAGWESVGEKILPDKYIWKLVETIKKVVKEDICVCVLSAGYQDFMEGVIKKIINLCNVDVEYKVIGTPLNFTNNSIGLDDSQIITQHRKSEIVYEIIKNGDEILFLADDSEVDMKLYEIVEENGGVSHLVKSEINENGAVELDWKETWKDLAFKTLKSYYMNRFERTRIRKRKKSYLEEKYMLERNRIGILCVDLGQFRDYMNKLQKCFDLNEEDWGYQKNNKVYLRGNLFYYWFSKNKNQHYSTWNYMIEKYEELFGKIYCCIDKNEESDIWELGYFIVLDHLFEGVLFGLNCIEKNNLQGGSGGWDEKRDLFFELAILLAEAITRCVEGLPVDINVLELIKLKLKNLYRVDLSQINTSQYLRENDDIVSTIEWARNIVQHGTKYDFVASFPYGGIALAFIIKAMYKLYNTKNEPEVFLWHYSSKQHEDSKTMSVMQDMGDRIPQYYGAIKKKILNAGYRVLLCDNNVTTYKSLQAAKEYLVAKGNVVHCTAMGINYDNLCKSFLGEECESLVSNWEEVLDYPPLEEYVTAYNTWNSSEKYQILNQVFFNG